MKNILLCATVILLFFSCKEEYFDGKLKKNDLVLNGNELIKDEQDYGNDFGGFQISELFAASNGNIYYRALKYIDREIKNYISEIGEMDINGNMLWRCEPEKFRVYGLVEDDHNNIYVYGSIMQGGEDKACIGKIENQSVTVIYVDYIPPEGGITCNNFISMKHESNGTFWWVGEIYGQHGVIGRVKITQDDVERTYYRMENWYYYGIYSLEKTEFDSYLITYPISFKPSQWGVERNEYTPGDFQRDQWYSKPIITDNTSNPNLESQSPFQRNNICVKNGNDLVVVGYGDNAEGRTFTDNNSKIPRGIVACLDYQTGAIKWKRTIPENNPEISGTKAYQIFLHNNKYYVIGEYNYHSLAGEGGYFRRFGYGFVQTISLSGELLDCYLFGKDLEGSCFYSAAIVGNKLLIAGYRGLKFSSDNEYNDLFVPYDGRKGWFVSCNIDDF